MTIPGFPTYTISPSSVTVSVSAGYVTVTVTMSGNFPAGVDPGLYGVEYVYLSIAYPQPDISLPYAYLYLLNSGAQGSYNIQINDTHSTGPASTYEVDLTYGQGFNYNGQSYPTGYLLATTHVTVLHDDGVPTITSTDKAETAPFTLAEDSTGNITNAPVTGVIHFTDTDTSQRPTGSKTKQTATLTNADGSTGQLTAAQTAALENAFTIAAASGNTNNGQINWTYDPRGTALDFLSAGQTAVVTSTIQVSGQNGTSDTSTVTVTIHGFDTDYWKAGVGAGNWSTAADWTQGVPASAANVVIDTSNPSGNVTLDETGTINVNSVNVGPGNTLS
jgi:hypothetical protein